MNCTRYFFHIGFNGAAYRGWQIQAEALNVQGVVEAAISKVLKEDITVMGCGRTDALVHASQFFFHADIVQEWDFDLLFRLNKILPADIAVFEIIKVHPNAHARFDATQRTYDYFIHTYKDPFLEQCSALYLLRNLDRDKMKEAVAMLPLYDDYRSFCTTPAKHRTTICQVSSAGLWTDASGDRIRFQISGNRFLSSMVRIIAGKIIAIGTGEFTVAEFEHALRHQPVQKTIEPAYPQGLFLSSVKYPFLDVLPRTDFAAIQRTGAVAWVEG